MEYRSSSYLPPDRLFARHLLALPRLEQRVSIVSLVIVGVCLGVCVCVCVCVREREICVFINKDLLSLLAFQ